MSAHRGNATGPVANSSNETTATQGSGSPRALRSVGIGPVDDVLGILAVSANDATYSGRDNGEHMGTFRGKNLYGDVVDLCEGTILGIYGNDERALAARTKIKADITSHTNFRIKFDSCGRMDKLPCIHCFCVLGGRVNRKRSAPGSEEQHPQNAMPSGTCTESCSLQQRRGSRAHTTKCEVRLVLSMQRVSEAFPLQSQWVVHAVINEHNHPPVPPENLLTYQQKTHCGKLLGAVPTTNSKRNCRNFLHGLGLPTWNAQQVSNLSVKLKNEGFWFLEKPMNFELEIEHAPMMLAAMCGTEELAFIARIAVRHQPYEASSAASTSVRPNSTTPRSVGDFTIVREHGSSLAYLVRGNLFDLSSPDENGAKIPLPPCPPRILSYMPLHDTLNTAAARQYASKLNGIIAEHVPSVSGGSSSIFLESVMWQTRSQQSEFNMFPEVLCIGCAKRSKCGGYQLVVPTSYGSRGTFRVATGLRRADSDDALRFVHKSLVWFSKSNSAHSGVAATRLLLSDDSPFILGLHEQLAKETYGADEDCAVSSCVFYRHTLKFWKGVCRGSGELKARLKVVRAWLSRLTELELETEFDHEWAELLKHCSTEFAQWPAISERLMTFLNKEHQDRHRWAWACQPRHMALFVKATSAAQGQQQALKWNKMTTSSSLYDFFCTAVSADVQHQREWEARLRSESYKTPSQQLDMQVPAVKRLVFKVMCASKGRGAGFRERMLNEVDAAQRYNTKWLSNSVCELQPNSVQHGEVTNEDDFKQRPWLKAPCTARLPGRVNVVTMPGSFCQGIALVPAGHTSTR